MSSLQHDLESFTRFAQQKIHTAGEELSIDDLYDQWRENHSTPDDAAAIAASVRDMENGKKGRDFAAFADEFTKRNGISEPQ
ncbi:MAG: hypothetical protein WD065_09420 [Planctomycetaceae bacterium]